MKDRNDPTRFLVTMTSTDEKGMRSRSQKSMALWPADLEASHHRMHVIAEELFLDAANAAGVVEDARLVLEGIKEARRRAAR